MSTTTLYKASYDGRCGNIHYTPKSIISDPKLKNTNPKTYIVGIHVGTLREIMRYIHLNSYTHIAPVSIQIQDDKWVTDMKDVHDVDSKYVDVFSNDLLACRSIHVLDNWKTVGSWLSEGNYKLCRPEYLYEWIVYTESDDILMMIIDTLEYKDPWGIMEAYIKMHGVTDSIKKYILNAKRRSPIPCNNRYVINAICGDGDIEFIKELIKIKAWYGFINTILELSIKNIRPDIVEFITSRRLNLSPDDQKAILYEFHRANYVCGNENVDTSIKDKLNLIKLHLNKQGIVVW